MKKKKRSRRLPTKRRSKALFWGLVISLILITVCPATVPASDASFEMAVREFNAGNYREALSLFLDVSRRDGRAFVGVGLSHFRLEDFGNAVYFLEKSKEFVKGTPDEFLVSKILSFAYYERDELGQSRSHAEKALSIKEDAELRRLLSKLEKELPAQEKFTEDATLHFRVIFDGREHREVGRRVTAILEDAYRTIGAGMNHYPRESITVILYTERDFLDVSAAPDWAGGLYDGKIRLPVRGLERQGEDALRRILFHEYTHAVVFSMTKRKIPLWMNEGLAEYFSGESPQKPAQAMPLKSIEEAFPKDGKMAAAAYRQSHAAVAYLAGRYGVYSIVEFLRSISRGEELNRAFSYSFNTSYDEFVAGWGKP